VAGKPSRRRGLYSIRGGDSLVTSDAIRVTVAGSASARLGPARCTYRRLAPSCEPRSHRGCSRCSAGCTMTTGALRNRRMSKVAIRHNPPGVSTWPTWLRRCDGPRSLALRVDAIRRDHLRPWAGDLPKLGANDPEQAGFVHESRSLRPRRPRSGSLRHSRFHPCRQVSICASRTARLDPRSMAFSAYDGAPAQGSHLPNAHASKPASGSGGMRGCRP
jgi:hypothetical protein